MSIDQRGFVVDQRAYCICDHDLPALNLRFLNSVDPTYFHYLAEIHRQPTTTTKPRVRGTGQQISGNGKW